MRTGLSMADRIHKSIAGVGTDIIEVERVERSITKGIGFKEKVFTENEIAYCEGKADKALHYAARFAAKEAVLKAMGTGWRGPLMFDEIEVTHDANGKPEILLYGKTREFALERGITRIHVSISHLKHIVNAVVLLQTDEEQREMNVYSTFVEYKNERENVK
jgi:holo-[acyl-carrier protein] synthase